MWFFSRIVFCLVMFLLLAGCGPVYKHEYAYKAPQNAIGKMCVSQCSSAKSNCQKLCTLREQNCRKAATVDARDKYQQYQYESRYAGKREKSKASDFDHSYRCSKSCQCRPAFNTCYNACGGSVTEKKVCVANCG